MPYLVPIKWESWGGTQTSVFFKNSSRDSSQDLIALTYASQILIWFNISNFNHQEVLLKWRFWFRRSGLRFCTSHQLPGDGDL